MGAAGDQRRIERTLLLGHAGITLALLLYALPLAVGAEPSRLWTVIQVLWPIVMAVSLLPSIAAQWAVAPLAAASAEAWAESQRVREVAASALTVALAGAFLFVCMFIAGERDAKIDVSYFKTSSPGEATVNIVKSLSEPLQVKLFFPAVNEVKDEVRGYFDELASRAGNVEVQDMDRMVDAEQAKQYRVTRDGMAVLVKGDQSRTLALDVDIDKARGKLRELDSEVQGELYKIARDARTAYLVTGHGELNDPGVTDRDPRDARFKISAIKDLLSMTNYRVKELGLRQGLANQVPDDATLVIMLGPEQPLLDTELASLDAYAARGGALLLAFEPGHPIDLGPLGKRLGMVRSNPAPLADTVNFVRVYMTDADRRNIATDQFSSHASVTTLSRARAGAGLAMFGARARSTRCRCHSMPPTNHAAPTWCARCPACFATKTTTSRSTRAKSSARATTWSPPSRAPAPRGPRRRRRDDKTDGKPAAKDEPAQMRALLVADATVFSDGVLASQALGLNRALVLDAVRWLGGEENFLGEVVSEKDVPIEHTKGKDVVWFYSTIIGAPLLVLGLGLLGVRRRRSRLRAREA